MGDGLARKASESPALTAEKAANALGTAFSYMAALLAEKIVDEMDASDEAA